MREEAIAFNEGARVDLAALVRVTPALRQAYALRALPGLLPARINAALAGDADLMQAWIELAMPGCELGAAIRSLSQPFEVEPEGVPVVLEALVAAAQSRCPAYDERVCRAALALAASSEGRAERKETFFKAVEGLERVAAQSIYDSVTRWSVAFCPALQRAAGEPPRTEALVRQLEAQIRAEDELTEAVYQFNARPRAGIQPLCELLGKPFTPAGVAEVLSSTAGLVGSSIGDFLCRPENGEYMRAYFDGRGLQGKDLVEGMRCCLSGPFHMPGEAQQVERTVDVLCQAWSAANPGMPGVEDADVLCFALVMLNTDMTNVNVKRHMTRAEFIRNTRGALHKSRVSDPELGALFDELQANPLRFHGDSDSFFVVAPRMRGWLRKRRAEGFGRWTRHFFILTGSCLWYYGGDSSEHRNSPLGEIQLTDVDVLEDPERATAILIRSLSPKGVQYVKFAPGKPPSPVQGVRGIRLDCDSADLKARWFIRLRKCAIMSTMQPEMVGGEEPEFSESRQAATEEGA
jgi:hypothetical protein